MTAYPDPNEQQEEEHKPDRRNPVFLYKDADIREHHGRIPLWLLGVVAVLIIWGIYYLVAFWSPPKR